MDRFKVTKTLLMNAPISITMSVVAQLMNMRLGHADHFDIGNLMINFLFSYCVAFFVADFIPVDKAGIGFARRCGAEPGTWKFDMLINLVVNTVFSVIMTLVMSWFNACFLGGAPFGAALQGFGRMIIPVWIACYFVSLFTQRPIMALAHKIAEK